MAVCQSQLSHEFESWAVSAGRAKNSKYFLLAACRVWCVFRVCSVLKKTHFSAVSAWGGDDLPGTNASQQICKRP